MLKTISHMCLWIRDQDEARDFYVDKLGFEVGDDVPFGDDFRWLTVHPPGRPEVRIALLPPHAGPYEPAVQAKVSELLALGAMNGGILSTDDCQATYEELSAKGVEFTEKPSERFYGIDAGFRDPSGNSWRVTQPAPVPAA